MPIHFIDRKTGKTKEEIVAGGNFLAWLYETKSGSFLLEILVKRKLFSYLYGRLQDTRFSKGKIRDFAESLEIDMGEAKIEDLSGYQTFNAFFSRELKEQSRPVDSNPNHFISPADGRMLAWQNIDPEKIIQVKGISYSLADLFQDQDQALAYHHGTCIVIRLCPADYHRFHFPDDGIPSKTQKINGLLYSVNPIALKKVLNLYCQNKRELTVFQSAHFGDIMMVEVGATCVGSIVQTYTPDKKVKKGDEKGYFKFGGSTVILLCKKATVKIDDDLLTNSKNGIETRVLMGEKIGTSYT